MLPNKILSITSKLGSGRITVSRIITRKTTAGGRIPKALYKLSDVVDGLKIASFP